MSRFLVATVPVAGHVTPMLAVAEQLVREGHEVRWYTGQQFRDRVEGTGAQFVPMDKGFDYSIEEAISPEVTEERRSLTGLARTKFDLKHFFITAAIGYTQDLLNVLEAFPADVILADSFFLAASWVSEAGGPPWAQLAISAVSLPSKDTAPYGMGIQPSSSLQGRLKNRALYGLAKTAFRDVLACINEARAQFSLAPTEKMLFDTVSPFLYLATTVPGFEYPRSDLPPQVHFIGPSVSPPLQAYTQPDWWDDLSQDRPVVHVTQGLLATDPESLIIPTIQALGDRDLLLVVTTAKPPAESLGDLPLPPNVRVASFIPYPQLLPQVDVMITNGGYGGVQMALAHGIPMVAAGTSEDKPEVCARIAWSGVGINLKTESPQPAQVQQAVTQLLTDEQYRHNAERLQTEIQSYQSAETAASLLQELASTKQPVLRP